MSFGADLTILSYCTNIVQALWQLEVRDPLKIIRGRFLECCALKK